MFLLPLVGEWSYNRLRKDPQAAYHTLQGYYSRLDELPQVDRDFLYQRVNERVWSDGQRRGFLATLRGLVAWLPGQQKSLPERLRGWTIPTMVVWGENDRINAVANAHALDKLMPSARLIIVAGAGHNVQQEQPGAIVEAILGLQTAQEGT
jgi:pimeloyl-ACP methyl ester carboxylesterase